MSRPWEGASIAVFLDGDYEEDEYYAAAAARAAAVVAADGGARFLRRIGRTPDLIVGDIDSLDEEDLRMLAQAGAEVIRHPVRKDATDGELALDEVLRRGAGEVVLAGALGALDHTWGHLVLLRRAATLGVPARIVSPGLVARVAVAPGVLRLDAPRATRVSLVPLDGDALVTLGGLEYPLRREVLPSAGTLGLGNSVRARAVVEVHAGVVAALVFDGTEAFRGGEAELAGG